MSGQTDYWKLDSTTGRYYHEERDRYGSRICHSPHSIRIAVIRDLKTNFAKRIPKSHGLRLQLQGTASDAFPPELGLLTHHSTPRTGSDSASYRHLQPHPGSSGGSTPGLPPVQPLEPYGAHHSGARSGSSPGYVYSAPYTGAGPRTTEFGHLGPGAPSYSGAPGNYQPYASNTSRTSWNWVKS